MWAFDETFYQIYPLGLCGAPLEAPAVGDDAAAAEQRAHHRILRLLDWVDHLERLGVGAVLLNPVFASDSHGYDTRDFHELDCRLGTNDDLRRVVAALHGRGIRVVLDAVLNHVGRGFWAFRDVLARRESSPYLHWFNVSLDGDSPYGDGLWYEGWEGHYELVKLNLANPEVADYLLDCVRSWHDELGIDGLRLDVAYCLDRGFMGRLRQLADELSGMAPGAAGDVPPVPGTALRSHPDDHSFALIGEMLHGDYAQVVNDGLLHSCTNYECYKGLYSSLNSLNLFEIAHSLHRQFGPDPWCIYRGLHLMSFADNHDVSRLATILQEPRHVPVAYGLLFGMPGIPCVYYGSEWGIEGAKVPGTDAPLRPELAVPEWNVLTSWIQSLAEARMGSRALCWDAYRNVVITNKQLVFERVVGEGEGDEAVPGGGRPAERVLVAVNADAEPFCVRDASLVGTFEVLVSNADGFDAGATLLLDGSLELSAYGVVYLRQA